MNPVSRIAAFFLMAAFALIFRVNPAYAQQTEYTIFDDKMLLDGYAKKYGTETKDVLIQMIKDDDLTPYMSAATIRVFRNQFAKEIVGSEKNYIEKILLRRLAKSTSSFVDVEVMHTLCRLDRYQYFESMVPALIQLIDHYNATVNGMAYTGLEDILAAGTKRAREARIVFNVLRKKLFLSRKKFENLKEPGPKLKQKLELVRWAIKILGTEELKKLPHEIIPFL